MIEQRVTSREISERLKELFAKAHIERESLFVHRKGMAPRMDRPSGYTEVTWCGPKPQCDDIPAYLASELGEVLPDEMDGFQLSLTYAQGVWVVFYENPQGHQWEDAYFCGKTMQEAMGLMLIWLIDNGHMEVGGE